MKFTSAALAAAAVAAITLSVPAMADDAKIKCEGINSCKGQSACKTADHGCKGQNSCKGHGWLESTAADCKAKGGHELKDK